MANNDVILEKLKGLEKLFNEKFKQNEDQHVELKEELTGKAGKWTEKVLRSAIGTILITVIGAVMGMILIKPTMVTMIYLYNLIQYV